MHLLDAWFGVPRSVCRTCGYDVSGLPHLPQSDESNRCPECGTLLLHEDVDAVRPSPGVWLWALSAWGPGVVSALFFAIITRIGFERSPGGLFMALSLGSIGLWIGGPVWYVREFVAPPRGWAGGLWMVGCSVVGNLVLCVLVVSSVKGK